LIFRLKTPPRAFTYLKYAFAPFATDAKACAEPESGVVPPTRIVPEVTPGSAALPANAPGMPPASASAVITRRILPPIGTRTECTSELLEDSEASADRPRPR